MKPNATPLSLNRRRGSLGSFVRKWLRGISGLVGINGLVGIGLIVTQLDSTGMAQGITPPASIADTPSRIDAGPYRSQLSIYRARANGMTPDLPPVSGWADVNTAGPMWWEGLIDDPIGLGHSLMPVDVGSLAVASLRSSPYVKGLLTEPKIRCNDLVIADAQFDTMSFVEANFTSTNDPIGSLLITGDEATRFRDELFASSLGVRKQNRGGGRVELVQRGGFQANNSTFLLPNSQGTSRLELNVTQPLLRDRGKAVNLTRVMLATIDVQLANSEVREQLQQHLFDVASAYWELYQARAEFLQRQKLVESAVQLHETLKSRGNLDSQQRQVLRAEVAIVRRRSEMVRLETRIRNAQSRLRLLTGDAALIGAADWEWLPQDPPMSGGVNLSTRQAILTALDHRPDIAQSLREIQAVSTRVGAARNQVLPRLDMILSSYVAGLDSRSDTFGAIGNQFVDGGPTFAGGFVFEMPVGNRANRARLERSRWELNRSVYDFQQTTETAFTEVEIAVREIRTAHVQWMAKKSAALAARREVDYLYQRWLWLPDPNESAVLLINDLVDAQERTADEERAVVQSHVAYALSWLSLHKAMGMLLHLSPDHGLMEDESPVPPADSEGLKP